MNPRCFCWRCLLSVTQPGKLWDGIKGIFWNFWVTRWGLELKLTSTIFGISGPGKKKILWLLWISTWFKMSMLSLDSTWNRNNTPRVFATALEPRLFFEQLFRVFFSFFQQFLRGHRLTRDIFGPLADMNSWILNSWLPRNPPYHIRLGSTGQAIVCLCGKVTPWVFWRKNQMEAGQKSKRRKSRSQPKKNSLEAQQKWWFDVIWRVYSILIRLIAI